MPRLNRPLPRRLPGDTPMSTRDHALALRQKISQLKKDLRMCERQLARVEKPR